MSEGVESPLPEKSAPSGSRRLPGRTPSGLLGKPGTLQLNQSTTPQQHVLPVKRRGSFQQLKKAGSYVGRDGASSPLDSDSSPSIFAVVKKSTHWEKYGTVLVLLVADELSSDREAILQMLSAEGYDFNTSDNAAETVKLFAEKEVYPDIVIIDTDNELVDTKQLIRQLQSLNPTVAVLVLATPGGPMSAVKALQAGSADYMRKPLDLDEVVARVERHVQRQHCIKLEMEKALEDAKQMMQQLMPASLLGDVMLRKDGPSCAAGGPKGPGAAGALNSVAETDFEEQMSELSEENHRLGQKVLEMERKLELKDEENRALEAKLNSIDKRVAQLASEGAGGQLQGQLDVVARANLDLKQKVDELARLVHLQGARQEAGGGGSGVAAGGTALAAAAGGSARTAAAAVAAAGGNSSSVESNVLVEQADTHGAAVRQDGLKEVAAATADGGGHGDCDGGLQI